MWNYQNWILSLDDKELESSLPRMEQEILALLRKGFRQKAIAKHLGITQGAVSHRISRSCKRLAAIHQLQQFDLDRMVRELSPEIGVFEAEIIRVLAKTTCQTQTAQFINEMFNLSGKQVMTQGKIRSRHRSALDYVRKLPRDDPKREWMRLLEWIANNRYKLHEVRLPHYHHR